MTWKPSVTVAAVMERDGRFLLVEEVRALAPRHRSPLVWRCIEDYLGGRRYPLDVITHFA